MWGGVSFAAASLACWGLYQWKRSAYGIALLATVGLLIWTSDQGGKLTHGETFLTERSPESLRRWLGEEKPTAVDPASFYAMRVQPIFEGNASSATMRGSRGKFVLDSYGHAIRGGKDGPVIHAGDPSKSELFRRVTLPPDDKDCIPAEGKPALSVAEIKLIELWIAAGATPQIAEAAMPGLPPSRGKSRFSAAHC